MRLDDAFLEERFRKIEDALLNNWQIQNPTEIYKLLKDIYQEYRQLKTILLNADATVNPIEWGYGYLEFQFGIPNGIVTYMKEYYFGQKAFIYKQQEEQFMNTFISSYLVVRIIDNNRNDWITYNIPLYSSTNEDKLIEQIKNIIELCLPNPNRLFETLKMMFNRELNF